MKNGSRMACQSNSLLRMRAVGRTPESRRWSIEMCQNGLSIRACNARASEDLPLLEAPLSRMMRPPVGRVASVMRATPR